MIDEFADQPSSYEPEELTAGQYTNAIKSLREIAHAGFDQPLTQGDVVSISDQVRAFLLIVGQANASLQDKYTDEGLQIVTTNPVYHIEIPSREDRGKVHFVVQPRLKSIDIQREKPNGNGIDYHLSLEAPGYFKVEGPVSIESDATKRLVAIDWTEQEPRRFCPLQNADPGTITGFLQFLRQPYRTF